MRLQTIIFFLAIYLLLDWYLFTAVKALWQESAIHWKRTFFVLYWTISIGPVIGFLMTRQLDLSGTPTLNAILSTSLFIVLFAKFFGSIFLFIDDIRRGFIWIIELFPSTDTGFSKSRSDFIAKVATGAALVPIATMTFGIASGAHDYRVRRRTLSFPNLPKEFDGLRVLQVSDIHTGSFFNKTAVEGGVDMINAEKPDVFFFTGDLVNDHSEEARDYLDVFKKVKAPLGNFSIMGNHDYGDYRQWNSPREKLADVQNLHKMHEYMGWDLLLNENRTLKVDGAELGIMGVENWGEGRFSKYGDLDKTYAGMEEQDFKILLSHDPSHWDAQVRPDHPDVDLTLSGHTHGFQFGVEIGNFKWSPSQYIYKQWADHYQEGNQHLYVNRGFGYIGYPGRIGILPEITVLELKRG